jgi:hypothetical protein
MHCQVCRDNKYTYKILLSDKVKRTIINAEWVSRFFGATHLVAKADRTQNWTHQEQVVKPKAVETFIDERWHGRNKPKPYRQGTLELFQEGKTRRAVIHNA